MKIKNILMTAIAIFGLAIVSNAQVPNYLPTNGLVGWWPFNGNANDESGNGNDGAVNGAQLSMDRFGNNNSSYNINGSGQLYTANIPEPWCVDQVSASFWFSPSANLDNSTSRQEFIGSDYFSSGQHFTFQIFYENGNIVLELFSLTASAYVTRNNYPAPNLQANEWYHVSFSAMQSSEVVLSLNGVSLNIGTAPNNTFINGATRITFGYEVSFPGPFTFYGKLDDIGIWNRTLTQQEIQQLYTGINVSPDDFTLYLDTIPGINGQEVLMPIRVKNFNNMLSTQFTLQFDPSVISYAGFQNPGIPSITGVSFGQTQINQGILTFAWNQPNVTPVSLANDELLVNLRFNVIGAGGSFSPITFINSPTPIEFVDQSFVPLSAYQTLRGRVDVINIASLGGNLKTETGQPVRSATLAATGFATESTQSNLVGQYSLLLPQGQSYSITPTKSNDTLVTNGITILDVLLIQRHILNTLLLNSPYKIIAADVNQSGTITSADLNLINALILANINAYPSGQFWAFVPDNHVFSNPQNPFPFPAIRTYNSLNTAVNQDFFGMKLGDVNNSYNPAQARLSESVNAVELHIENQNVTQADTILVPVRVKNFSDIAGFQFGMQWDAQVLRYIEINPANSGLDVNKGETMTEAGKLNINWIEPNASTISLDDESVLFNITFEVLGGLGSNTDVEIYSSTTAPVEIINGNLEVTEHLLESGIISVTAASSIAEVMVSGLMLSAYPNPFTTNATLTVESDIQRNAVLEIFDATGRMVSKESISLPQGSTAKTINLNQAAGNYLLVLSDIQSGLRLASLKLIKQ